MIQAFAKIIQWLASLLELLGLAVRWVIDEARDWLLDFFLGFRDVLFQFFDQVIAMFGYDLGEFGAMSYMMQGVSDKWEAINVYIDIASAIDAWLVALGLVIAIRATRWLISFIPFIASG